MTKILNEDVNQIIMEIEAMIKEYKAEVNHKYPCEKLTGLMKKCALINQKICRQINKSECNELSNREIEVVKYTSVGLTTTEIAEKLFISINTVEKHRSNIYAKCNIRNVQELVLFALKTGIIF